MLKRCIKIVCAHRDGRYKRKLQRIFEQCIFQYTGSYSTNNNAVLLSTRSTNGGENMGLCFYLYKLTGQMTYQFIFGTNK